jgi:moderate conductance mechanosensitive channel
MALIETTNNTLADPIINGVNHIAPKIPAALVALLFGFVLIRIVSWLAQAFISLVRLPRGLKSILVSLIDGLLWIFLLISVMQSLGLNNIALVFSGSVAAAGLALAAGGSTLVSDILAGIFLAKDRDFSIGDEVVAGENQTVGVVEGMDMRRTRIRDKSGQLHIIPNSVIERKEWVLVAKKKDRET